MSAGAAVSCEGLMVIRGATSKMVHSHGCWQEFSCHKWTPPWGCLTVFITWQLASFQMNDPRESVMR